ncbi:MAG: hypothetical protein K2X09_06010, partial [Rickettsiales bacterium]|nr:hypothetical protein [Rickettsiales bacterium]
KAKAAKPDDKAADETPDETPAEGKESWLGTIWKKAKTFFSSFTDKGGIGKIIGGILGLGGAWLAGNFFGGGILSTILTIALAIPFMLAGSDAIGGWINGMLGGSKKTGAGDTPGQGQEQALAPAKTKDDLNQKFDRIKEKYEAYTRVMERRIRTGEFKGLTIEQLNSAADAKRTALGLFGELISSASSAANIKTVDDALNLQASAVDDLLKTKPEIQAEVRTELKAIQSRAKPGSDGASAKPTPVGPALRLTNIELNAIIAPENNKLDRVVIRRNSDNVLTVFSVADSVPADGSVFPKDSVRYVDSMRDIVTRYEAKKAADEGRAALPITGITFTPLSNDKIRIVGTTVGTLPASNNGPSR